MTHAVTDRSTTLARRTALIAGLAGIGAIGLLLVVLLGLHSDPRGEWLTVVPASIVALGLLAAMASGLGARGPWRGVGMFVGGIVALVWLIPIPGIAISSCVHFVATLLIVAFCVVALFAAPYSVALAGLYARTYRPEGRRPRQVGLVVCACGVALLAVPAALTYAREAPAVLGGDDDGFLPYIQALMALATLATTLVAIPLAALSRKTCTPDRLRRTLLVRCAVCAMIVVATNAYAVRIVLFLDGFSDPATRLPHLAYVHHLIPVVNLLWIAILSSAAMVLVGLGHAMSHAAPARPVSG